MQEFVKPFHHIKTLRSALKSVDSSELQKFIDKMNVILQEKQTSEKEEQQRRREENKKLKQALSEVDKILESTGFDMDDLIIAKATKSRVPTHVLHKDGKEIFYVGTGRMPKEFEEYVNSGGNLDDLKIKKER